MEITVYPACVPSARLAGFDFAVFGKHAGRIRYGEDDKNPDSVLYRLCAASRSGVAVALAETTAGGAPHRSALVADRGKLLGITDEITPGQGQFRMEKALRVYRTSLGDIGVMVGEDLYAFQPARVLTACGARLILHLAPFRKKQADTVGAALAYFCKTPLLSVAAGVAALYGADAELLYASPVSGGRVQCPFAQNGERE